MIRKLTVSILALVLAGCAAAQVKRDTVLERSADRAPDWALKLTFERDGNLYAVGEGTDREGYPLAQRIAKVAAVKEVAEAVNLKVKTEVSESLNRRGHSDSGSFIQDTAAMVADMVTIQNFEPAEQYREKVLLVDDDTVQYRVKMLYRLPLNEYKAAKARALAAMADRAVKAQDRQAEADARALLSEVKGQ